MINMQLHALQSLVVASDVLFTYSLSVFTSEVIIAIEAPAMHRTSTGYYRSCKHVHHRYHELHRLLGMHR